jgi:hypothetical protein
MAGGVPDGVLAMWLRGRRENPKDRSLGRGAIGGNAWFVRLFTWLKGAGEEGVAECCTLYALGI